MSDEDVTQLKVGFNPQELTKQVQEALLGVFENVVILGGGSEESVDLVLRSELTYDPRVKTRGDGWLLSCFCFALGGPLGWFINDREYESPSRMTCSVSLPTVSNASTIIPRLAPSSQPTEMTFWNRADSVYHYLGGLVMPAVLLASESEAVGHNLTEAMGRKVSEGLALEFLNKGKELHRGPGAEFELIEATVVRSDRGYQLQGTWSYRRMNSVSMEAEYWLAGQPHKEAKLEKGQPNAETGEVSQNLRVELGAAKPGSFVHFLARQRGGSGAERTYTLRVPPTDS